MVVKVQPESVISVIQLQDNVLNISEFEVDDNGGFEDYIQTTVDPGPTFLVVTILFCLLSQLLLPCMVTLDRRRRKRGRRQETRPSNGENKTQHIASEVPLESKEKENRSETKRTTGTGTDTGRVASSTVTAIQSNRRGTRSKHEDHGIIEQNANLINQTADTSSTESKESSVHNLPTDFLFKDEDADISKRKERQVDCYDGSSIAPSFVTAISSLSKLGERLFDVGKGRRCRRGGRNWIAFGGNNPYQYFEDEDCAGIEVAIHNKEEDNNLWDVEWPYNGNTLQMAPESFDTEHDESIHRLSRHHILTLESETSIMKDDDALSSPSIDEDVQCNECALQMAPESSDTEHDESIHSLSRHHILILEMETSIMQDDDALSSPSIYEDIQCNERASAGKNDSQFEDKCKEDEGILNLCCGENAWWKPVVISQAFRYVMNLAKYDKETRSIFKLAIPYSFSEVMEAIFEAIGIGLVGHYLGTDSLIAYSVVDILISISSELVGGIIDTEASLCSHAIGAGNNMLAGQYVQLAVVIYCICQIPFIFIWSFGTEGVLLWMDFDNHIAELGQEYARVAVWSDLFEGIAEAFHGLLEVAGYEVWTAFIGLMEGLVEILLVLLVVTSFDVTLVDLAYLSILVGVVFFVGNVGFTTYKRWTRPYIHGMIGTFALKNRTALSVMVKTAVPLSVGALLANGEWEMLTIFAAALGPAEVATWAILGSIWDIFEASTEGIGDAAEVRCAHHLGKGNPEMAKTSSYKSILFATILSLIVSIIFFSLSNELPRWFTTDPTLQRMIKELIPLVGIGNITMTFGMVCWALVGAQGRYALATFISFIGSWCITIPLSAFFVFGLNVDLQGVTSAVVIGYSCTGTVLSFILLRSDWEYLSETVQNLNALSGEVVSDSDEDDSLSHDDSSESSSSSSSSSDSEISFSECSESVSAILSGKPEDKSSNVPLESSSTSTKEAEGVLTNGESKDNFDCEPDTSPEHLILNNCI